MNVLEVIRNEFLHNLGEDHIAVDHTGTPIARATTHEGVEKAAPGAAAYFSGAEIAAATPETAPEFELPAEIVHSADNDTPVTVTLEPEPIAGMAETDVDLQNPNIAVEPAVAGEGGTDTQEPFNLGIDETPSAKHDDETPIEPEPPQAA